MGLLRINGVERSFPGGEFPETLAALLELLNVEPATVVAEIDGEIVTRKKFGDTAVREGQDIELVRFVGGG